MKDKISEYFNTHLKKEEWDNFQTDVQTGAIAMAMLDIELTVDDELNSECRWTIAAIAEQALFIARNNGNYSTEQDILSESIDGLGSASYRPNASPTLCRRARELTKRILRNAYGRIRRG